MDIKNLIDKYDFFEILNPPKEKVEKYMNNPYKKIYNFFHYVRRILTFSLIYIWVYWLFNKEENLVLAINLTGITLVFSAIITQQMRKYIVRKNNL